MAKNSPPFSRRIFFMALFLLSLALAVVIRYGVVMLGRQEPISSSHFPTGGERGPILDKNGRILAIQTRLDALTAWRPYVQAPEESSEIISQIIDEERDVIYRKLTDSGLRDFVYLSRQLSPTDAAKIRDLKAEGLLKGIYLEPEYVRTYPGKELASHIIGYVGTDNKGLDGLEFYYNHFLSPPVMIQEGEIGYGNHLYLTIDINIQYLVEKALKKAFDEHSPDFAVGLVVSAKDGKILGYASQPSFDLNRFRYYDDTVRSNRPAVYSYEPGSVFKVFSMAALLQLEGATPYDIFETNGVYNPPFFRDNSIQPITDLRNNRTLSLSEVLVRSSNVGISYAMEGVPRQDFYDMLRNFGFGAKVGLPLPLESVGLLRPPSLWSIRSKPTIAFGQEVGVTALQVISAATVFANSGILLKLHIVDKEVSPSGEILHQNKREPIREVVSPQVGAEVLMMMREAVESPNTIIRGLELDGIEIAAKSGTSQVIDPETGEYSSDKFIASLLALLPADDPELIIYSFIVNPKSSSIYGGIVMPPVVKEIAEGAAPYLGIKTEESTVISQPKRVMLASRPPLKVGDTLPNFEGYSKREVLNYLNRGNLRFLLIGSGWVAGQSPPAGSRITSETRLLLEFQ